MYEAKQTAYHYEAKHTLVDYLQKWGIPMLGHIDTRAVVKKIRNKAQCQLFYRIQIRIRGIPLSSLNDEKVCKVTTLKPESFGNGEHHIVLVDFGSKRSIVSSLIKRDCKVTAVPYEMSFEEIQSLNPDGILLSNGPGDPKDLQSILPTIKKLISHYPTLGICLGHQLAALALGANTEKLLFGHRGANHPVIDLETGKVFMSSQNHSYDVDHKSLKHAGLIVRFSNLHDQSVEGMVHNDLSFTNGSIPSGSAPRPCGK